MFSIISKGLALNKASTKTILVIIVISLIIGTVYTINGAGDAIRTVPCLALIAYGIAMPSTGINDQIGIRLPWVMSSERTWRITHKLTGPVCTVFGLLWLMINLLFSPREFNMFGMYVGSGALIACIIASLVIFWTDPVRKAQPDQ